MSPWSDRQLAMLQALGLGDWRSLQAPARAEPGPSSPPPPPSPSTTAPVVPQAEAASALAPQAVVARPASAPTPAPTANWPDLESLGEAVRACRACGLCEGRRQAVPGVGNPRARWLIVGEGPGEQEDLRGEPFVGPSGRLLDEMLAALGLTRAAGDAQQQVYIANSVKCRPPGNRNPTTEELRACAPFLERQIALIQPQIIVALGRFAVQAVLGSEAPIGRLRGQLHRRVDGRPVVVSYHPAYLLRQPLEKAKAWDDLCLAATAVTEASR